MKKAFLSIALLSALCATAQKDTSAPLSVEHVTTSYTGYWRGTQFIQRIHHGLAQTTKVYQLTDSATGRPIGSPYQLPWEPGKRKESFMDSLFLTKKK